MKGIKEGRAMRDRGLAIVELTHHEWIAKARKKAVSIARRRGQVSINDVRDQMELPPDLNHNALGAVLRSPDLKVVGFETARHKEARGRVVRVYGLKKAA
jgi:hypothetical protein